MTKSTLFSRADVEVIEERVSFKGFFQLKTLRLRHRLFEGGWSAELNRELFVRGHVVGVLLYDPLRDEIALVEQFRIGALHDPHSPWLFELVAGIIEPGESPEEVAHREAQEEAGCAIQALLPIVDFYSSPGGGDEYFYVFCGKVSMDGVGGVHGLPGENEDIRVHVMSVATATDKLAAGELNNAQTIIAVQWLLLNRERVRRAWM